MNLVLIESKLKEVLPSWGYELCSLSYKKEMGRVTVSVEEALLIAHFLQREISYLFGQ